ncbi:hypothetical protein Hanom_Chr02g00152301 [Helianthus anomalus]
MTNMAKSQGRFWQFTLFFFTFSLKLFIFYNLILQFLTFNLGPTYFSSFANFHSMFRSKFCELTRCNVRVSFNIFTVRFTFCELTRRNVRVWFNIFTPFSCLIGS